MLTVVVSPTKWPMIVYFSFFFFLSFYFAQGLAFAKSHVIVTWLNYSTYMCFFVVELLWWDGSLNGVFQKFVEP